MGNALVSAADLDLVINLARRDESLLEAVEDELRLTPIQRLRRALPDGEWKDARRGLRWLSRAITATIVIGGTAGVLHGAPQRLHSGRVEFVSADPLATERQMAAGGLLDDARAPWTLPKGGTLALASNVPGTDDYRDLRRSAVRIQLDKNTAVTVAHPRDLLRMADASPREPERAQIPGLRALLDREPARPRSAKAPAVAQLS